MPTPDTCQRYSKLLEQQVPNMDEKIENRATVDQISWAVIRGIESKRSMP